MADRPQDQRITPPTILREGHRILNIDSYAPFLLNAVSSRWQRKSAAMYRERYGFGITDWRVIAMLAIEPEITANRICEVVRLDKAATSRALRTLEDEGIAVGDASGAGARNRCWRLTDKGIRIHDEIIEIALKNETEMVAGVPFADLEICLRTLRTMLANMQD